MYPSLLHGNKSQALRSSSNFKMEFCDEPFALGLEISPPNYTPLGKSFFRFSFHLGKPSTESGSPVILVAPAALEMRKGGDGACPV